MSWYSEGSLFIFVFLPINFPFEFLAKDRRWLRWMECKIWALALRDKNTRDPCRL